MKIAVTVMPEDRDAEPITGSLLRFERMRSVPGLVVIGAIALVAILALPGVAIVAAVAGFALMGVLTLSWLRTARKAASSVSAFDGPSVVDVLDWGIAVTRGTARLELLWPDVLHVTKAKAGWIFVARESRTGILLPARLLTDAEIGQLTVLLSSWSARRYRRSPW